MRVVEKRLRERIKALEKELAEVKADREIFRSYFANNLKWFIELLGNQKSPSVSFLVTDTAKFLNRVQRWHW